LLLTSGLLLSHQAMSCRTSRISAAAAAACSLLLVLQASLLLADANRMRRAVLLLPQLALQAHRLNRFCST
jgi:hypothetical protein